MDGFPQAASREEMASCSDNVDAVQRNPIVSDSYQGGSAVHDAAGPHRDGISQDIAACECHSVRERSVVVRVPLEERHCAEIAWSLG